MEFDKNTFLTPEQSARSLVVSILLQSIQDYITLKKLNVIEDGEVNEWRFGLRKSKKVYKKRHIGYDKYETRELLHFFKSNELDRICRLINYKACRIRKKLNILKDESLTRP